MSSPEERTYNTIFMGPLSHRETRVDELQNAKRARWSEEAENEYLESVKARATEKVRALLLQAKRRSDEIIKEAEKSAHQITQNANNEAQSILSSAKQMQAEAEQRFHNAYGDALNQARNEMHQELVQSQRALGESTAVVLLSIHEQLSNLYNVWKEDLKQLTLEAIQVGTGWIATTEKEQIIRQLLDESVQKLLDKKDYIVRVNPADAELVTQVLENSRDKSWSMESSKELEPGSLEVENSHVFVKNSSYERQKFVQDILDNLALPKTEDDEIIKKNVTDAIMHEMQTNPILAQSYGQDDSQEAQVAPQPVTQPFVEPVAPQQTQESKKSHAQEREMLLAEPLLTEEKTQEDVLPSLDDLTSDMGINSEVNSLPDDMDFSSDENPEELKDFIQGMAQDASHHFDENGNDEVELPSLEELTNPHMKVIDELPDYEDLVDEEKQKQQAHEEAEDMVEAFLQEEGTKKNTLPNHVADDLLAEMGFSDKNK